MVFCNKFPVHFTNADATMHQLVCRCCVNFCVCVDAWCSRRSLSGVSNISVDESLPIDPRENNYDSSESESERNENEIEACVLTHRHVR